MKSLLCIRSRIITQVRHIYSNRTIIPQETVYLMSLIVPKLRWNGLKSAIAVITLMVFNGMEYTIILRASVRCKGIQREQLLLKLLKCSMRTNSMRKWVINFYRGK